ncbi:PIR Superfamily Protein [Plasmodium ovale wallikeri]|uniref:PIR Superfamily Protein n=2 Tax=Plasmodium ovale TaxID=36330 RepID=A0A1A9ALP8_PLAOA|nr:PIR Superfamily Protein [Plasmodium ovale wallikeri]SBT57137.1 PIR Superfamily Protein [Plasmodium ovale wallikeri]SBT73752.1 Plasmodium vivax Vir protein, putative [Plasmodium ovale]
MAGGHNDRGYSGLHPSDLFSEKFYSDMNIEHTDLSNYNPQCDTLILNEKNKSEIKEICKKYLRYLDKNIAVWNSAQSGYNVCILLNYWIYDKLTDLFGADETLNINNAFGSFQLLWNYSAGFPKTIPHSEKCKPNFDLFKHHDWKKRKELYDYYVNFDMAYSTANNYDEKCEGYYKYIEGKVSLYQYFENICTSNNSICPDIYDKCLAYNPNSVLRTIKCHDKIVAERALAEAAAKARSSHNSSRQEQESGPGATDAFSRLATDSGTMLSQENANIGSKFGQSVLGVAPVLLTATALYRYTPIGTWFRNLGGTNPNSMSNINEGEMDGFFGDSENYISYQPM